jgi:hypothetical protein
MGFLKLLEPQGIQRLKMFDNREEVKKVSKMNEIENNNVLEPLIRLDSIYRQ